MNPIIEKAKAAPLLSLTETEFRLREDVIVDSRHPSVSFVWFATTLTGRQSVHQHSATFYRTAFDATRNIIPTQNYGRTTKELRDVAITREVAALPRLPSGYEWIGPYFVPATMTVSREKTPTPAECRRRAELTERARNILAVWSPA